MARMAARNNEKLLRALSAVALAAVTAWALNAMPFYPPGLAGALALAVGALALFSPGFAALVFVGALSIPVMAADLVVGVVFLILGLIATQYLSEGRGGAFVLAAVGLAAIPLHAEWAAVAVAGYLLGRGKGAATTAAMCAGIIGAGIVLGVPAIGSIATGGTQPGLIAFSAPPAGALTFGWLMPAVQAANPMQFLEAIAGIERPAFVLAQVVLWSLAALVGGSMPKTKVAALPLAGSGLAVGLLAVGHFVLDSIFDGPVSIQTMLVALAVSLPLALAVTALAVWVFPVRHTVPAGAPAASRDVDDLLRTIASAEDELAARHKTQATVLITDMKGFSAMTEEIGSVDSAKIVQRHRDLLLPVIAANRGRGCATGGDGLVAAFVSPADAAAAAVAMQRTLEGYTGSDRSPHELLVRVGVASGEVVLDAAGCPFLGAALNLAARVMDLADGGRIMMTDAVAGASQLDARKLHAHGEYKLKNIAEAVPVVEVLWRDGEEPQEIRAS